VVWGAEVVPRCARGSLEPSLQFLRHQLVPSPTGKIAREVKSEDRKIGETEVPSEEEQPLGSLAYHLRPIQQARHCR